MWVVVFFSVLIVSAVIVFAIFPLRTHWFVREEHAPTKRRQKARRKPTKQRYKPFSHSFTQDWDDEIIYDDEEL